MVVDLIREDSPPFMIGKSNPLAAEHFFQDAVLFDQ